MDQGYAYIYSFNICGVYQVTRFLGEGTTGEVWRGFDVLTGTNVAIKTKRIPIANPSSVVVAYEAEIYKLFRGATEGIPHIHWSGVDEGHYVLVMDLLGPTIDILCRAVRGSMTPRTICMLAEQMLSRLQFIHSRGVVSGDVKPQNFAMGTASKVQILHIFDFSHAQLFIDPSTGEHVPFRTGRRTFGTPRYASVAAHLDHEVSRRDDIESLLYVLLELYHGRLPWQGISGAVINGAAIRRIGEMKVGAELQDLLASSMPELRAYHAHCLSLTFGQTPDYDLLKGLFRQRMRAEGWAYDWNFDWNDPSGIAKGTLVPEDYVHDLRFVEKLALNPTR